jgi:hypothetical protein
LIRVVNLSHSQADWKRENGRKHPNSNIQHPENLQTPIESSGLHFEPANERKVFGEKALLSLQPSPPEEETEKILPRSRMLLLRKFDFPYAVSYRGRQRGERQSPQNGLREGNEVNEGVG